MFLLPRLLLAITMACLALAPPATADTIELRADDWCPFNCDPDSDSPGFMVEIATEALALAGHTVNYQTMNWSRSVAFAEAGRINGIIGTDTEESPDFIFGPPLGTYLEVAAFRRGAGIDVTSTADLAGLRLGVIQDYDYGAIIDAYIAEAGPNSPLVQVVGGDNALEQNLRKLLAGRIDLVAEEHAVLAYQLSLSDMQDAVDIVPVDEASELFIAFSPALESSHTYAAQLSAGVAQLRASGRLAEILTKYGLTE